MEAHIHTLLLNQEESNVIERVARIVSSVRGPKPDYTQLAAELAPAIPFDLFGITLLRHDHEAVRVIACTHEASGWVARYHQHPLKDSKVEQFLTDQPIASESEPMLVINDYMHGIDGLPTNIGDALSGHHHLHSTLIAPLMAKDRLLGSLELGSIRMNAYADVSLQRLIKALVRVLAAAIESAQAEGSIAIQDRQRQALKNISHALTSKVDLPTILQQIVEGIAQVLDVASAIIILKPPQGTTSQSLQLQAHAGIDSLVLRRLVSGEVSLCDQDIIGYSLRHLQPATSYDLATDGRFPQSWPFATQLAIRSLISYPLVADGTVYGTLLLCSPEAGGFTPLKTDILSLFASQATIAISNSLLLTASEERRDEKNKSVLLSSVSHDLRTPLTTIKAAVTGLLEPGIQWDEQTRQDILEEIDAEADHLTHLVNALIEMSRIEMGALILEKEWCDLVEIVHTTLARLTRLLASRSIQVEVCQELSLPLVQADYVQLERVLYNLLENAIRYSPHGAKIHIAVSAEDTMLHLRIIDHGPGVPETEREQIFKTFYSLDNRGGGLGLAICRGIVAAHQGRIWVEPAQGGGSCFVFTLPLHPPSGAGKCNIATNEFRMVENFTRVDALSTREVAI